jgi:hypothetical protein
MWADDGVMDPKEIRRLADARLEHLVDVREPLVLIGHKGRSGGTLLNQLFDGHPGVHAHPHELELGRKADHAWPVFDLGGNPHAWFELLAERHVARGYMSGYAKGTGPEGRHDRERLPFLLPPSLQRHLFLALVARDPPGSQRDVFDRYFASYFNAWLDNQNL